MEGGSASDKGYRAQRHRRFHMKSHIGRGAFGEVYRAMWLQPSGQIEVAIKVLHAGLKPESDAARRLVDEARTLGMLNHPAIPCIFDFVIFEERLALVTEYIRGMDLDGGTQLDVPLSAGLDALSQVADTLDAMWSMSGPSGAPMHLVHRDVKPSNIRLGQHGNVKLLDFGIAKMENLPREAMTRTDAVVGSFAYMAPERIRQEEDAPPGDVYALGCTLFEIAARRPLLKGLTYRRQFQWAQDARRHDQGIAELVAGLDAEEGVRAAIVQSLKHDSSRRPDAFEFAETCEKLLSSMDGPNLRRWAKQQDWAHVDEDEGDLSGSMVTARSLRDAV